MALSGSCLWAPLQWPGRGILWLSPLPRVNTAAQENTSSHLISGPGEHFGTGIWAFETADSTACLFSKPTQGWSWPRVWVGILKIRNCSGTISHTLQGCHFANIFMLSYLPGTTQLWGTAGFQSCEKAWGTNNQVIPRRALSSCFVI